MHKTCVGIIFGGPSLEHEVSLQSAKNIINFIDKNRFNVLLLGVDKDGSWNIYNTDNGLLNSLDINNIMIKHNTLDVAILPGKQHKKIYIINQPHKSLNIDVMFPIIHGKIGEDGSLQGLLQLMNIPYVGSGVLSSAISMDKDIAKRLLKDAGLLVTPFVTLTKNTKQTPNLFHLLSEKLGVPMFVKPANMGSSIGISKVDNSHMFNKALDLAFNFDTKILVESFVVGRELECAVLGNKKLEVSVCGEIILENELYSYHNKYNPNNKIKIVIPADISKNIYNKIRCISLQAFRVLHCTNMARIDMFLTDHNEIWINEINTLPGFTKTSMFPRLWEASGLNYTDLITKLIELALESHNIHVFDKFPLIV